MAGAPPPLPSSRPKGAYVPPPVPSNRPKVAYVHPLPPTIPEPLHEDVNMKASQQTSVINTDALQRGSSTHAPSVLGRQLQVALQDRMMNNLNQMSSKQPPASKPSVVDGRAREEAIKPVVSNKPQLASKPNVHPTPLPAAQLLHNSARSTVQKETTSYNSFTDSFGGSAEPQQTPNPQMHAVSHSHSATNTSTSSAGGQLASVFGSSSLSSRPTGTNVSVTATSDQKKAAANYLLGVTKDASKNVSAKDAYHIGGFFASAFANNGKTTISNEQQAAMGRISSQVGASAVKNVTATEICHASNFAATNAINNLSASKDQSNQQSSMDLLAQVMGSKGGGLPPPPNSSARARPKPSSSGAQPKIISGIPPPPSPPTSLQKMASQPQSGSLGPPRAAPKAPPAKTSKRGGSSLIDFSDTSAEAGFPSLAKSKTQGMSGSRAGPTIIRSASPAVEQQQKKSKPPPRPSGPPTKKAPPSRPNAVHGTRSAGSTPPRPSGLKPKRKAPPRPGIQKGKNAAPGTPPSKPQLSEPATSNKRSLPPRPGPGHPLYNKYMGSEPHGIALFDYKAQEADELSFQTNDVILLVKRIDSDWLVGKCNKKKGMFPTQYIKVVKDLNESSVDNYDGPQAVALYGFQASAADELTFQEGDTIKLLGAVGTVWLRGELNGKSGIFPSNHVEVIIPLPSDSPSHQSSSGPRCRAKFEYSSGNPEDLSFDEGNIIKLTQRVGEEWYRGELDGKSGIFPAAFIDILEDLPPQGADSNRSSPTTGNEVHAAYDFDAANSAELSFKEGEKITVTAWVGTEWLEGELNGKKGRFPANYVDRVPPGLPQVADAGNVGVEPHCVVSFDFEATEDDEMTLKAGEKITLLERIGDEWLRGKIASREGIFPRSFVDVIIDLPSAGATPSEAKALCDFEGEADDDLKFKMGDLINITERVNDEWLQGSLRGKTGKFPAAFVQLSS